MNLSRALLVSCALCCLVANAASAQYTVKKIIFDGTIPYPQTALEAICGMKPGDAITKDLLQQAAQRLVDTGAFDDVQASLDGPYKSINVIFKIVPATADHLLSASFENFAWWTPEELTTELEKRVTLFNGTVPASGNIQDAVLDALKEMLAEKQIAAIITSKTVNASAGRAMRTISYRIASPDIRIRSFILQHDTASPLSAQTDKLLASLNDSPYNNGTSGASASDSILDIYRNSGYLDAALGNLQASVVPNGPDRFDVDIRATLQPGELYHVAEIEWPGSSVVSSEEFLAGDKLHPGDLASHEALIASLASIETAYRRQGYYDVIVDPSPQLDRANRQVTYSISVTPGIQYILAVVNTNLPPGAVAQFQAAWKLQPGSIYDATYLATFLKANIGQPYLQPYRVSYKIERDTTTRQLTVNLTFLRRN
jgi:outer membrane protein insertion porin family